MARPTRVHINASALLHNVNQVKHCAPHSKIIAMVKANAYGCGIATVVPTLFGQVDAFGVACLEEAMAIRTIEPRADCILFQGTFSADELAWVSAQKFQCVIHQPHQLQWLLTTPLAAKIKIWVKVNTGMHRLGFAPQEVYDVLTALAGCSWVEPEMGLITHLACADEVENSTNQSQLQQFSDLNLPAMNLIKSIANSAAILSLPLSHADVVRPGIMLYGASPFPDKIGREIGLMPVMHFVSAVSAIHHYPAHSSIGYNSTWQTKRPSIIGVVAVGYGDGYPRRITQNTPVWVNGYPVPIVGRISMDMLTIDLTDCPSVKVGDQVELWGKYIPVETIAKSAGTIPHELLCQVSPRAKQDKNYLAFVNMDNI